MLFFHSVALRYRETTTTSRPLYNVQHTNMEGKLNLNTPPLCVRCEENRDTMCRARAQLLFSPIRLKEKRKKSSRTVKENDAAAWRGAAPQNCFSVSIHVLCTTPPEVVSAPERDQKIIWLLLTTWWTFNILYLTSGSLVLSMRRGRQVFKRISGEGGGSCCEGGEQRILGWF